jgi:hypothetical protein
MFTFKLLARLCHVLASQRSFDCEIVLRELVFIQNIDMINELNDDLLPVLFRCVIDAEGGDVQVVCKLCCVSKRWQSVGHALILSNREWKLKSNAMLLHFCDDDTLDLLSYKGKDAFTKATVLQFTNLTSLKIGQTAFDDQTLMRFTKLTRLQLTTSSTIFDIRDSDAEISDRGLQALTNLTQLNLDFNFDVTDAGVRPLTNLARLSLRNCNTITEAGIAGTCTNLRTLILEANHRITDRFVMKCTNLSTLVLNSSIISNAGISELTNLTVLSISRDLIITNAGLSKLTALVSICFRGVSNKITREGLRHLTNLTRPGDLKLPAVSGGTL